MDSAIEVATIAGSVSFVVGLITSGVSLWIYRNQTLTDANAVRVARKLMTQCKYEWRAFDFLKRRIGGFEDDELRKILVRAGAVRFYRKWEDLYFPDRSDAILSCLSPENREKLAKYGSVPIEVWGLINRQGPAGYMSKNSLPFEAEHNVPGFEHVEVSGRH
jgi:hypothetical protein